MFDGLVSCLLLIGAALGVAAVGLIAGALWLFSHLRVQWVS